MTFLEEDVLYPSFGNTFEHYSYSTEQEFILGETYKVNLDGTVYECVAKYDNDMGYIYLGNGDLNGCAEATNDPFVLFNLEPGVAAFCTLENPDGDHTLSVTGNGYAKKSINGDYIAGGLYKGSGANSTHTKENEADGMNAFAIGSGTKASNYAAFATGEGTTANGAYSVTEGQGTVSTASAQDVQGKYNIEDTEGQYAHIVGNGKREYGVTTHSNAHTLDWNGNAWYAGDIKVGGSGYNDENAKAIATQEYVNSAVAKDIAFIKQGDTIQTGDMTFEQIDALCKNQPNKCNVTLAITAMNASGELEAETCYAQNITRCMSLSTGQASYLRFCFITFDGTTIKFQINPDNTITNI